jgi:hypothetical protein
LELWEWLLRMAIVLFPLDVVRRVQLDPKETARAWRRLYGWLFPWHTVLQTPQPAESLSALLLRRDQVRSGQQVSAPAVVKLVAGKKTIATPVSEPPPGTGQKDDDVNQPNAEARTTDRESAATTTSRLLDAKRRAQERKP